MVSLSKIFKLMAITPKILFNYPIVFLFLTRTPLNDMLIYRTNMLLAGVAQLVEQLICNQ